MQPQDNLSYGKSGIVLALSGGGAAGLAHIGVLQTLAENAAPNCAKVFTAEWKCGNAATVYAVTVPAGSMQGEHLRLSCSAFQ